MACARAVSPLQPKAPTGGLRKKRLRPRRGPRPSTPPTTRPRPSTLAASSSQACTLVASSSCAASAPTSTGRLLLPRRLLPPHLCSLRPPLDALLPHRLLLPRRLLPPHLRPCEHGWSFLRPSLDLQPTLVSEDVDGSTDDDDGLAVAEHLDEAMEGDLSRAKMRDRYLRQRSISRGERVLAASAEHGAINCGSSMRLSVAADVAASAWRHEAMKVRGGVGSVAAVVGVHAFIPVA
ncbi:unnamed protein product [Urochloa humidicola]